jgi:AcrR family transcriptional regulator
MVTRAEPATRREPLNRDRVLRAAVELADREGIGSLSMRKLGQELGVEAMSLYNHVANKEDLLDGMVDVIVDEIGPGGGNGDWKATIRQRMLDARQVMLRHPWASQVVVSRKQITPTMMRYMDTMIGILRDGGLSIDLAHHAFHVLGSRILGFVQELYDDSEALAESPEVAAVMLRQMADQYPHMTDMALAISHDEAIVGAGCDDQTEFEFSIDLILDGVERRHRQGA